MAAIADDFDVFLSYSPRDEAEAQVVRGRFIDHGLDVFDQSKVLPGQDLIDRIRQALAESKAFVVLLTPRYLGSPNLTLEVGASLAWAKPLFGLMSGLTAKEVPAFLRHAKLYPVADVDKVARCISSRSDALSEDDRQRLIEAYRAIGVPTDQLVTDYSSLTALSDRFNANASKVTMSRERLLRILLRLRKRGILPKVQSYRQRRTYLKGA